MRLAELVEASRDVAATSARPAKIARRADALTGLDEVGLRLAVSYLSGVLPQGRIGVGWAAFAELAVDPAATPSLRLVDVDAVAERIAATGGAGSQGQRAELVAGLFAQATEEEQRFLRGLFLGELRQGAKEGVVVEAVARATGVKAAALRRGVMLLGDLPEAAAVAARGGEEALAALTLQVGRPVRPMLASSAPEVADALEVTGSDATVEATASTVVTTVSTPNASGVNSRVRAGRAANTTAWAAAVPPTSVRTGRRSGPSRQAVQRARGERGGGTPSKLGRPGRARPTAPPTRRGAGAAGPARRAPGRPAPALRRSRA